jgi:hypothetical protein
MTFNTPIEHSLYIEQLFANRFIKHSDLKLKIGQIKAQGVFKVKHIGNSAQQREIYQFTIGHGETSIMLWSQMHGNEPTGTLAFFDLFNFFTADDEHNEFRKTILDNCTLHFIPILNPDGAEMYQRRNAQGIDINRDFLTRQSPEAQILIDLQQAIKPEFGFNMHDQDSLWSVTGSKKPASISLLAPPADAEASLVYNRFKAMLVTAAMYKAIKNEIPDGIARWSEEYEPRSFGDNFQKLGMATILVESGGYPQDFEKQYVRKLNFKVLLEAFIQIATQQYKNQQLSHYYAIPTSAKELFHLLIKNCKLQTENSEITVDIGLNILEQFDLATQTSTRVYAVADIGDLSTWNAYDIFEADGEIITLPVVLDSKPSFKIKNKNGNVLHIRDGLIAEMS